MHPTSEADLAEAIATAKGALRIQGGATRDIGAPVIGTPLSTEAMDGIVEYEPGALTLVARAGTPLAQIEAALAAEGQRLPFEPMDHRPVLGTTGTPTIGGVVAANVSGPRRVQVGACRDFLLGARFVDGAGRVLKNGGRVMKNVTGYDLVKLMAGSFGTLGVITEVSFKVLPIPETQVTLAFSGHDPARAVATMAAALSSPFEVSGAAWVQGQTLLRLEGMERSVAYRVGALAQRLQPFGQADHIQGTAANTLWQTIRDAGALVGCETLWRVSLKPSDAPAFLAAVDPEQQLKCQIDWGGGLIWLGAQTAENAANTHARLRAEIATLGGHVTMLKAPTALRTSLAVFQPEPPATAALARALRHRFDPKAILNPGLMG
ncbi:MAG: glycolate oxidase subunit GlcE [Rhodobacteraceae bacterium]|nr:glycolate oxidase subunit GlcE [Paracoccaceae bacterium]